MQVVVTNHNSNFGNSPLPPFTKPQQKFLEETVVERILTDDDFLRRSVVAIFSRQTPEEQRRGITMFQNERGLNAADVFVFGPMAERVLSGAGLSERDLAVCRALLPSGIPWLGKY